MNASWQLQGLEQRIHQLLRFGVIEMVDLDKARLRVRIGEVLTDWLPWLTSSAGNTRSWRAPSVGEQVLVMSPSGDLTAGVVLPALYQERFGPPAREADTQCVNFPDGSQVSYDAREKVMSVRLVGDGCVNVHCRELTIQASEQVRLNTPKLLCSGDVSVGGKLDVNGRMQAAAGAAVSGGLSVSGGMSNDGVDVGRGHRHSGVEGGRGVSGGVI